MGCEREVNREEIEESDRTDKTWEIRKNIGKYAVGKLTIEELVLIIDIFKSDHIETPSNSDFRSLLQIQRKLKSRSDAD